MRRRSSAVRRRRSSSSCSAAWRGRSASAASRSRRPRTGVGGEHGDGRPAEEQQVGHVDLAASDDAGREQPDGDGGGADVGDRARADDGHAVEGDGAGEVDRPARVGAGGVDRRRGDDHSQHRPRPAAAAGEGDAGDDADDDGQGVDRPVRRRLGVHVDRAEHDDRRHDARHEDVHEPRRPLARTTGSGGAMARIVRKPVAGAVRAVLSRAVRQAWSRVRRCNVTRWAR